MVPIAPPNTATPKNAIQSLVLKDFNSGKRFIKKGVRMIVTIRLSIKTTRETGKPYKEGRRTIPSNPQRLAAIITKSGANLFIYFLFKFAVKGMGKDKVINQVDKSFSFKG